MADSEPVVQYTLKEILDRIERKIDAFNEDIVRRVTALEHDRTARKGIHSSWVTFLSTAAAIGAAVAAFLAVMHG